MAEELAQETFAEAMTHHRRHDGRRPFGAWLSGIALNLARKHYRKQQNRSRALLRLRDTTEASRRPEDPAGSHLRRERRGRFAVGGGGGPRRVRALADLAGLAVRPLARGRRRRDVCERAAGPGVVRVRPPGLRGLSLVGLAVHPAANGGAQQVASKSRGGAFGPAGLR
jgi:hypothetical protein